MANEKVISTQALIDLFKLALTEKWGYIWGTAGETWTAAKQEQLKKTTDADRENSRKYGGKWIGHKVADCSGLFSWAFKQLGGYMYHGSDTMFRKYCTASGELRNGKRTDGQDLKPGTAVFTYNKGKKKYGHVGLYIGGGYVIEARGAYYGVTMTKIESRPWTWWGELKGVDYSNGAQAQVPEPAQKPALAEKRPIIRKGNKNKYVTECQRMLDKLGYNLGICGIDGDFGTATRAAVMSFQSDHGLQVDGIVGPDTWRTLDKAIAQISGTLVDTVYSVIITGLDKSQAEAIAGNYPGSKIIEGSAE